MKQLTAALLSFILLSGCGASSVQSNKTAESATEIRKQKAAEQVISSNSGIIYRERLYNIDSYTKSNLIIQSNGSVWYGTYMHNEGQIDRFNHLWTSEEEYTENYRLDDDEWLAAVLTETKEDDFMLFGECEQITTLSESEISELTTLISETDPFSAVNFHSDSPDEAEPAEIQTEYNFIDLVIGGMICRAYANTQSYECMVQDQNAAEVIRLIHNSDFYGKWRDICKEKLIPYNDQ